MFNKAREVMMILLAMSIAAAGCGRKSGDAVEKKGEEESAGVVGAMTPEQVMSARCSHGLTYECAECRYEVGVVKVDKGIMKAESGSKTGLVQTIQAGKKKVTTVINISGEVRLNENSEVHISPVIAGVFHAMNVGLGSRVKKGDELFSVNSSELGTLLCEYGKSLVMKEVTAKNFQREKSLYEQKIGSELEMGEAEMKFKECEAGLRAAEQKLHVMGMTDQDIASACSNRESAQVQGVLSVRSPIDGSVIEKHGVKGEMAEPGKDVIVVADLGTVWMWGTLYERDLAIVLKHVSAGPVPVEVSVPAFPEKIFRGNVDHVAATMDESTRTVKIRVTLDNREGLLRPGMFCEGKIILAADEEVFAVPASAVLSDEGVDFVFRHMKDDYFLRQNVKKGREFAGDVEILAGLEAGQTIVSEGSFLLKSDVLRSKMGAGCAD